MLRLEQAGKRPDFQKSKDWSLIALAKPHAASREASLETKSKCWDTLGVSTGVSSVNRSHYRWATRSFFRVIALYSLYIVEIFPPLLQ